MSYVIPGRMWDHMPRWPKPHIKLGWEERWAVIFTNPRYPHTRFSTGEHAETVAEAWAHLPTMCAWYSCPLPPGAE